MSAPERRSCATRSMESREPVEKASVQVVSRASSHGRQPSIVLGPRSVQVRVPRCLRGRTRTLQLLIMCVMALYVTVPFIVLVALMILDFNIVAALVAVTVCLIFAGSGIRGLIVGSYALWGWEAVTVEGGIATVRYELWGRGYQHLRIDVGHDAAVEVVEAAGSAFVRVEGFRSGAGLKRASFEFGGGGLDESQAQQIAERLREAIQGGIPASG